MPTLRDILHGCLYGCKLLFFAALIWGCIIMLSIYCGCASTGGYGDSGGDGAGSQRTEQTDQLSPWLTPRPLTIYELNQAPETIRHAFVYRELHQFMWALVSPEGVAEYSPMSGAVIPQTPVTILTRRTR